MSRWHMEPETDREGLLLSGLEVAQTLFEGAKALINRYTDGNGLVGYDRLGSGEIYVPGKNEAFITRIDIFSEEEVQRTEFIEVEPHTSFEISDMQFDGTYIYVAYRLTEGQTNRGVIQRLLP